MMNFLRKWLGWCRLPPIKKTEGVTYHKEDNQVQKPHSLKTEGIAGVVIALGILVVILGVGYAYYNYYNNWWKYYNIDLVEHDYRYCTEPVSFIEVAIFNNGEVYTVYFSLRDGAGRDTAWDGTVNINITQKNGILYEKTFTVKQSEFQNHQIVTHVESWGTLEFFGYAWTFSASDVRSLDCPNVKIFVAPDGRVTDYIWEATITFTTPQGKILTHRVVSVFLFSELISIRSFGPCH